MDRRRGGRRMVKRGWRIDRRRGERREGKKRLEDC
jgi:hypothetical protein